LELFTKIFERFGELLTFKNKSFQEIFSYSEKRLEFITFDHIVDILLFIYLFILIIFDVLLL